MSLPNQENYYYAQPSTSNGSPYMYGDGFQIGVGFHHRPVARPVMSVSDPAQRLREKQQQQISMAQQQTAAPVHQTMGTQRALDWMNQHNWSPSKASKSLTRSQISCGSAATSQMSRASTVMTQLTVITNLDEPCLRIVSDEAVAANQQNEELLRNLNRDVQDYLEKIFEAFKQNRHQEIAAFVRELDKRAEYAPQISLDLVRRCMVLLQELISQEATTGLSLFHAFSTLIYMLNRRRESEQWLSQNLMVHVITQRLRLVDGLSDYVGKMLCLMYALLTRPGEMGHYYQKAFKHNFFIDCMLYITFQMSLDTERRKVAISVFYELIKNAPSIMEYAYQKRALDYFVELLQKEAQYYTSNARPQSPVEEPILFYTTKVISRFLASHNETYKVFLLQRKTLNICALLLSHGSSRLLHNLLKIMAETLRKPKVLAINKISCDCSVVLPPVLMLLGANDPIIIKEATMIVSKLLTFTQAKEIFLRFGSLDKPRAMPEIFTMLDTLPQFQITPFAMMPNFFEIIQEIKKNAFMCFSELLKVEPNPVYAEETARQFCLAPEGYVKVICDQFSQPQKPMTIKTIISILFHLDGLRRNKFLACFEGVYTRNAKASGGEWQCSLPMHLLNIFFGNTVMMINTNPRSREAIPTATDMGRLKELIVHCVTEVASFCDDANTFFNEYLPGPTFMRIRDPHLVYYWMLVFCAVSRSRPCPDWLRQPDLLGYLEQIHHHRETGIEFQKLAEQLLINSQAHEGKR